MALRRFEQGRFAVFQMRVKGTSSISGSYTGFLPRLAGVLWVNRRKVRRSRRACFLWYPQVEQNSFKIADFIVRDAVRYRFTIAARYSRFDRGLIRINPPWGGIIPVTWIMSQRYISKFTWVTFIMSQFVPSKKLDRELFINYSCYDVGMLKKQCLP